MIVPSTRIFTAGEVETGAYLNASVTNLGNFMLGKPICQLRQTSGAQTSTGITNATATAIDFDVEDIDRDNGHSTSTNPSRYTAATAGWYFVSGAVGWSANATGLRTTALAVNGTLVPTGVSRPPFALTSNVFTVPLTPQIVYLNVNDYVTLVATQSSGSTLTTSTATSGYQSFLSLVWVSL